MYGQSFELVELSDDDGCILCLIMSDNKNTNRTGVTFYDSDLPTTYYIFSNFFTNPSEYSKAIEVSKEFFDKSMVLVYLADMKDICDIAPCCELENYSVQQSENGSKYIHIEYDCTDLNLLFEIVPKWFQSMDYFVIEDYNVTSPNNRLADSVKKLMKDFDSDVSITLVKTEDGKSDYICVNSYDSDSNLYTTYVFYGTKADRAKIDPKKTEKSQVSTSNNSVNNHETFIQEIVKALNKNGKSTAGDKFYENLKITKNAGKRGTKTEDQFGNPLPATAYEYIIYRLYKERSKGPISKYTIAMIESGCAVHYTIPQKFKISVSMSNSSLANVINSLPYKNK